MRFMMRSFKIISGFAVVMAAVGGAMYLGIFGSSSVMTAAVSPGGEVAPTGSVETSEITVAGAGSMLRALGQNEIQSAFKVDDDQDTDAVEVTDGKMFDPVAGLELAG